MARLFFFIGLLFSFAGHAQKFSSADIRLLSLYSTGTFSNELQAKADSHAVKITFRAQPIWINRKDGMWLFTEKTDSISHYQVWHFYLQDDTTALLQFLNFKSDQQAAQISKDIKQQSKLYIYNLLTSHSCDLYFKKNKTVYTASSDSKDCFANQVDVEYITRSISFTKNSIDWQENDFDKTDKQVKTATSSFIKQVIKSPK